MLFSNDRISNYINKYFEPVWVSVRDVPIITVDLGNNKKITRTLHGNVATLVCNSDGHVLDVIPGVYEPIAYLDRLIQFRQLYYSMKTTKKEKFQKLSNYHRRMAKLLQTKKTPHINRQEESPKTAPRKRSKKYDASKTIAIEGPLETGLFAKSVPPVTISVDVPRKLSRELNPKKASALWNSLIKDTEYNETVRRLKIHKYLAEHGQTSPFRMKKWLYKEVLDTDLDDPYFGLSKLLFDSYPFEDGISNKK